MTFSDGLVARVPSPVRWHSSGRGSGRERLALDIGADRRHVRRRLPAARCRLTRAGEQRDRAASRRRSAGRTRHRRLAAGAGPLRLSRGYRCGRLQRCSACRSRVDDGRDLLRIARPLASGSRIGRGQPQAAIQEGTDGDEEGGPGWSRATSSGRSTISPASLPGRRRWVTSDADVRAIEDLLGIEARTIGAPIWVSGDSRAPSLPESGERAPGSTSSRPRSTSFTRLR